MCAGVEISPGPSLVGEKERPPLARDEDVPELWRRTVTVRNSTRMRFPRQVGNKENQPHFIEKGPEVQMGE